MIGEEVHVCSSESEEGISTQEDSVSQDDVSTKEDVAYCRILAEDQLIDLRQRYVDLCRARRERGELECDADDCRCPKRLKFVHPNVHGYHGLCCHSKTESVLMKKEMDRIINAIEERELYLKCLLVKEVLD